ncbi:MAG: hypothetical protein QXM56_02025 [Acidilobaceae archaeon]
MMIWRRGLDSEEEVIIKLSLPKSEYERLRALAKSRDYTTVSEYVKEILRTLVKEGPQAEPSLETEQVAKRLERMVADLLNPFTAKIDEVLRRLSHIQELLETSRTPEEARAEAEVPPTTKRTFTAIERLKREGVVFSEDVRWLRAPEKFFERLKREGAVVIERGQEKIAIDKDFWKRFLEEVRNISVSNADEAAELIGMSLGEGGAKLFKKLTKLGLLVYDEDGGEWISRVQES